MISARRPDLCPTLTMAFGLLLALASCGGGGSAPTPLPTPVAPPEVPGQLAPANGAIFNHYPRDTTLAWAPVPRAASYWVEVQGCEAGPKVPVAGIDALRDALANDPGEDVRIWTAAALGSVGPAAAGATELLMSLSKDVADHPLLAKAAQDALVSIRGGRRSDGRP